MQPLVRGNDGTIRFQENSIVRFLLDEYTRQADGLNGLADYPFSQADWEQFYQLIGTSVGGYHEKSEVSDRSAIQATCTAWLVYGVEVGCRQDGCDIHSGVERE